MMRKTAKKDGRTRGVITRQRLIEVAGDQFVEHGFHGTSMRRIASKAGVAVGGIYNHFGSKDALFAAVLDADHPYHAVLPALAQLQGATQAEFISHAMQQIWEQVRARQQRLLPLILIELVEFQGRHLQEMAERLLPTLIEFVNRFNERAEPLALPAPLILRGMMSLVIGHMLTEMILARSPLMQQLDYDWFAANVDIYLHGILRRAAPAAAATPDPG